MGDAGESSGPREGARGRLGADRHRHCWLPCGETSLSPNDKSTHHLFLELVLGMTRATAPPGSRQGGGGDGNHPWSIPPPEHRAGMLSGSGSTLPSAGERGRSRAAGQRACKGRCCTGTAGSAREDAALARGPQQGKVPVPSTVGGVWARSLSPSELRATPPGRDGIGQGQLPGTKRGPYSLLGTQ